MARLKILDQKHVFPADYPFILDGKVRSPWFDNECQRRVSAVQIAQELEIDYGGSTYKAFEQDMIDAIIARDCRPPFRLGDIEFEMENCEPLRFIDRAGGPFSLWTNLTSRGKPPSAAYAIGADVSFGSHASNSVLSIVNRSTGEKVGEYATKGQKPSRFAKTAVAAAKWFSDENHTALLIWEAQGPGLEFSSTTLETGWRGIWYHREEGRLSKKTTDKPGWYSAKDKKVALLGAYRKNLEESRFINRSRAAILECEEYEVLDNGSWSHTSQVNSDDPTGLGSNHGDRVIADALANKLLDESRPKDGKSAPIVAPGTFAWRRKQFVEKLNRMRAW